MARLGSLRAVRSRQALFFLLAIVVPCGLLVVLTVRMLVQERELADKRVADERRRVVADVRQELLSRVEAVRLQAETTAPAELVLSARVEDGRLVLPWERDPAPAMAAAALEDLAFRDAIRLGEQEEYGGERFLEAAAAYRTAITPVSTDLHRAAAQTAVARALSKAGRAVEAATLYRAIVTTPPSVVDDQGIPFALYAARRLLDPRSARDADRTAVGALVDSVLSAPMLRPATLYLARDLIVELRASGAASTQAVDALHARAALRVSDVEQALELQKGFAAPAMVRSTASATPTWVPFGSTANQWLVNYAGTVDAPTVVAVRAEPLFRATETSGRFAALGDGGLRIAPGGGDDALSPNFPGLHVVLAPTATAALASENRLQRPVYLVALAVVLSTALFVGYLFWRDVQREIRLAELRSQFVSSVSHELKTPLTAIRMFAETLLMGRSARPEVREEYLETIVQESERLTRLLNNVLDFSKIEQGTKTYRLEPHSPAALVQTAGKAMQYLLAQQGFHLRITVDDDVPAIAADADAIQQAILNLLGNAMKYSGAGRDIELDLRRDGANAVIAVTDHGIGIPAAEHTRIFQKFYRVPGEDNQRIAGTGLGLTLVEHVARAHGGAVTVRSAPGQGSTFSLALPLVAGAVSAGADAEALA